VDDLLKQLGQRIRELRNQKGWSQEEFADVCGVHRTYMGHLERGEKNLSFRSMMRVAEALGVPLSVLFSGLEKGDGDARSYLGFNPLILGSFTP
jgi:transcriptional regulator with XRE-family HTH domain